MKMISRRITATAWLVMAVILLSGFSSCNPGGTDIEDDPSLSWHIEMVDTEDGSATGRFCSLELDSNGFPHIAYLRSTGGDLMYAHLTGSSWIIEEVDTTGSFTNGLSLALDSEDQPHIAYGRYDFYELRYSFWNGTDWNTEILLSDEYAIREISIRMCSADYPYISYNKADDSGLYCAYHNGGPWTFQLVDTGNLTSIVLDSNDRPRITYSHYDNYLGYAAWNGSSWDLQIVEDPIELIRVWRSSIDLDAWEHPHIVYNFFHDGYIRGDILKYAYWDGASWYIEAIAPYADWPSMDIDTAGLPHIAYYDPVMTTLKYACYDGSCWTIRQVDTEGAGQYASLELDEKGHPHISYFDGTSGVLKYAWYGE